MSAYVTDTNALLWRLTDSPRLTAKARICFEQASDGASRIYIPVISLVEMVYLSERGRVSKELLDQALRLITTPAGSYALATLDENVLRKVSVVPRASVPDMPDRIILATALALNLPLITSDSAIHAAALGTIIW